MTQKINVPVIVQKFSDVDNKFVRVNRGFYLTVVECSRTLY